MQPFGYLGHPAYPHADSADTQPRSVHAGAQTVISTQIPRPRIKEHKTLPPHSPNSKEKEKASEDGFEEKESDTEQEVEFESIYGIVEEQDLGPQSEEGSKDESALASESTSSVP